ncbi:hypothetical protein GCM10010218_39290 [Streptomyces mashuensis]|uniref:Major facilitator superfamily (MFS) profile domain-containing protein n=1 Tax=Streptomyces mashuensis TaxID=33904 RepID=A0A919B5E5_9ACTN|nr:MFS transporter [Streptomyces mashuensis]GHF54195.1 hypothetical protein GCM10010218_39290 [Streptomyces mashuensis]
MRSRIRFRHELTEARWDDLGKRWRISTTGRDYAVRVLITGTGCLSETARSTAPCMWGREIRAFVMARHADLQAPALLGHVLPGDPATQRRGEDEERRAVGAWVATAAAASCAGPLLGGLLTSTLGWRAIFGALAVLAAVTAGCALNLLPRRLPRYGRPERRLDGVGIALCTAAATTALIALTAPATGAAAVSVILLAVLWHRCRHHADSVLDSGLIRNPSARSALFVLLVLFCANSMFTFLTYFALTRAHGLSPLEAPLVGLPAVTPAVFTGRWAGRR